METNEIKRNDIKNPVQPKRNPKCVNFNLADMRRFLVKHLGDDHYDGDKCDTDDVLKFSNGYGYTIYDVSYIAHKYGAEDYTIIAIAFPMNLTMGESEIIIEINIKHGNINKITNVTHYNNELYECINQYFTESEEIRFSKRHIELFGKYNNEYPLAITFEKWNKVYYPYIIYKDKTIPLYYSYNAELEKCGIHHMNGFDDIPIADHSWEPNGFLEWCRDNHIVMQKCAYVALLCNWIDYTCGEYLYSEASWKMDRRHLPSYELYKSVVIDHDMDVSYFSADIYSVFGDVDRVDKMRLYI